MPDFLFNIYFKNIFEMKKMTQEDYIEKCKNIHNNRYDYSLVKYDGMNKKIKIICKIHGEFEQNARNHINGINCKYCVGNNIKSNKDDFIEKSKKIHGDKYNYDSVDYINCETKVKIICPDHGIFEQRPTRHFNGDGCSKCSGNFSSVEKFIQIANKVHNNKYDYSLINYKNNKTKVKIICKDHGIFEQRPDNHIGNIQGCPICGIESSKNKTTDSVDLFISKSNKIHNNKYDYSLVNYKNSKTKVKILCSNHGDFLQTPNSHLRGNGCPVCQNSKGENKICEILDKNNIKYNRQKTFSDCKDTNELPFDFYLINYHTCIEFDGIQHFIPIEYWGGKKNLEYIKKHDKIKDEYCQKNKIKLIRIRYNHKNIENIILEIIF